MVVVLWLGCWLAWLVVVVVDEVDVVVDVLLAPRAVPFIAALIVPFIVCVPVVPVDVEVSVTETVFMLMVVDEAVEVVLVVLVVLVALVELVVTDTLVVLVVLEVALEVVVDVAGESTSSIGTVCS